MAKYKTTSIGTALRSGKVKAVVEGDLTAIGNISETMDWGGVVLGAVMVPHAAKQGSFAQADDAAAADDDDGDDDDEEEDDDDDDEEEEEEEEEEDNWDEHLFFSGHKLLETLPGYRS